MTAIPCSVIVLTKNEEPNIRQCIRSVQAFAEVFVVDSDSTDQTQHLAIAAGANVIEFRWNGKYPKKKQWSLDNLPFSFDWVLFLDADEQVPPELATEIREILQTTAHSGLIVGYDYVFDGRILTHGAQAEKLVLFNRHKGRFVEQDDLEADNMWEVEGHYQPVIVGTVGHLQNRMLHNDHESLFHYFDRHNRYTDWEAVMRSNVPSGTFAESHGSNRARMKRIFAHMPGKPLVAFVYSFVIKRGFLDGRAGFDFAMSRAFYYWQVGLKQRELKRRQHSATRPH